jgi:hypothetical protein
MSGPKARRLARRQQLSFGAARGSDLLEIQSGTRAFAPRFQGEVER